MPIASFTLNQPVAADDRPNEVVTTAKEGNGGGNDIPLPPF
jgi:hypothetical protein